jgi:hypothetical protein
MSVFGLAITNKPNANEDNAIRHITIFLMLEDHVAFETPMIQSGIKTTQTIPITKK